MCSSDLIVVHDGLPLQQGPFREDEPFLSVKHGPFKIIKGRRCVRGGPDDVFLEMVMFSAVGQLSNWKHLIRLIQLVNADGGSCCVCLSEPSNLVGCPQCTATMCHACFVQMGSFHNESGWTATCPQCRHTVTALKEDTPSLFIPWFYKCDGSPKSRVIRRLVARLTLHSLKTGEKATGTYVFKVRDAISGGHDEEMPFERISEPNLDHKDGWYRIRCVSGSVAWEAVVPADFHRLFGWKKL